MAGEAPESRLDGLLIAWEERRERGEEASPEELCRDCPELIDELRRRIRELEQWDRLPAVPRAVAGPAAVPSSNGDGGRIQAELVSRLSDLEVHGQGGLGIV